MHIHWCGWKLESFLKKFQDKFVVVRLSSTGNGTIGNAIEFQSITGSSLILYPNTVQQRTRIVPKVPELIAEKRNQWRHLHEISGGNSSNLHVRVHEVSLDSAE